jgi:hypothetical protein
MISLLESFIMLYMVAGPSPRLHICSKYPLRLVVGAYLVSREMVCPIFLAATISLSSLTSLV